MIPVNLDFNRALLLMTVFTALLHERNRTLLFLYEVSSAVILQTFLILKRKPESSGFLSRFLCFDIGKKI